MEDSRSSRRRHETVGGRTLYHKRVCLIATCLIVTIYSSTLGSLIQTVVMIEHPTSSCVLAGEPLPAGAISMPVGAEVLLERLLDRRRPEVEYKVG